MEILGTRRVMETTSHEEVNQYIRFGWKLLSQRVIPGTDESPPETRFVLASIQTLEDTRFLVHTSSWDEANEYLRCGWRLIEKFVTSADQEQRSETLHFVLAWQLDYEPTYPADVRARAEQHARLAATTEIEVDIVSQIRQP